MHEEWRILESRIPLSGLNVFEVRAKARLHLKRIEQMVTEVLASICILHKRINNERWSLSRLTSRRRTIEYGTRD